MSSVFSDKKRFYRSRIRGKIAGVCGGVADYFNCDVVVVRIVAIVSLFLFTAPTVVAYLLTWALADKV